jgi:hypothetical protein
MTHATRRTLRQCAADCGLAALFFAGLLLAGSEGPLFPWPNLAGVALFGLFALLARGGKA